MEESTIPTDGLQYSLSDKKPQAAPVIPESEDFPLGPACDLSGEGTCEACQ